MKQYKELGLEAFTKRVVELSENGVTINYKSLLRMGEVFVFNTDEESPVKEEQEDVVEEASSEQRGEEDVPEQEETPPYVSKEQHIEYIESATKKELVEYMESDLGIEVDDNKTKKELKAEALEFVGNL